MQSQRFLTEIWSARNPKIQIASTSWRNFMEQERLDAGYTAFVTELHRRLAAAGSAARFSTGMPVINYWIGVVVFGAALLALVVMTLRALQLGEWAGAAIIGVLVRGVRLSSLATISCAIGPAAIGPTRCRPPSCRVLKSQGRRTTSTEQVA